jgi:superoxide reductase
MGRFTEHVQEADWKQEKHVPVIECPDRVTPSELFDIKVTLGKEVAHPNTTEHHIRWISVFFQPDGGKFTHQIGHFEFCAHGESAEGANQGPVYTHHGVTAAAKITASGMVYALSLCNIHGLWQSAKKVELA